MTQDVRTADKKAEPGKRADAAASGTNSSNQQAGHSAGSGGGTPGEGPVQLPVLGVRGAARFIWAQLTSMRTALVLLFALAVAAIPGSLLPQRSVSPVRVSDFIKQHSVLGPVYDWAGLFEVYTSAWFSAIYLLLFVSLIGCIIPRVGVYARALRRPPPPVPRNLSRLPVYVTAEPGAGVPASTLVEQAAAQLRRQRYRTVVTGDAVAAERGYFREGGNLLFHLSLLVLLVGVSIGVLFGYRGSAVVMEGQGFANNLTQYDDITAGAWFSGEELAPFGVTVKNFDAKFETGPVQRGAARLFRADLEVTDTPDAPPRAATLEVNKPLSVGGTKVHLIGHGYAPQVTVRDGNGQIAYSGPVVFLPQDGSFTSVGAIKAPDARPARLGFEGIFVPTSVAGRQPQSVFPDALAPALYINAFTGPPAVETGRPENIYSLDTTGLTQLTNPDGSVVAVRLTPGESYTLPGGHGSIQLDGWNRWVKLQIGNSPGVPTVLTAVAAAVLGLCLSLFIRPRRVWVRLTKHPLTGNPLLEVGGLDRADARGGLHEDLHELASTLTTAAPSGDTSDRRTPSEIHR